MPREKKKLSYGELEEHVIDWWVDSVVAKQEIVEQIIDDESMSADEKELVFEGIADSLEFLLELIIPLYHDEEKRIQWIEDFLDEYQKPLYLNKKNTN